MAIGFRPEHPDIDSGMWGRIDAVLDAHRGQAGAVIAALRECQEIVGYLPVDLMQYIADGLNLARSDVFGVASFYALFSLTPKGRHTIKVCTGTACYVKGIKEVIVRISNAFSVHEGETSADRRFSLEGVRCLGACGLAPVIVVDENVHGRVKTQKMKSVLDDYQ